MPGGERIVFRARPRSEDKESPAELLWTCVLDGGDAQLRGYYCLESDWTQDQESEINRGTDAEIAIVNPELEERSNTSGPAAVETLGADYGTADADSDGELDGLPLYTYQVYDPAGTWRGIFMADDNAGVHSPDWRTHTPVRMLTANGVAVDKRAYAIVGRSATDRMDRHDALAAGIGDAGYVEILINTEITDADDPAIGETMRKSHYFHFSGHSANLKGFPCVHWIQIAGANDTPRNLGMSQNASWAAELSDWLGRVRHAHLQGCSTAVPCLDSPCNGRSWRPSIADFALQKGAESSAGAREGLVPYEAVLWMDAFYGYANERDGDGKFIRDMWGAIQDATDKMDRDYPGSSYGRIERQGVMVPTIKYIGPRNILIAPR